MQHRSLGRRLVAAVFTLALASTLTPAPAQAAGASCAPIAYHRKNLRHITNFYGTVWVKHCIRPRAGRDIMWMKPASLIGTYALAHRHKHPWLWCPPFGGLDYYVFRVHIKNNVTGYNARQGLKMWCQDDGHDQDLRGLVHLPRCYMPWIIDHAGRIETGHRAYCHYTLSVEEVHDGPAPNSHYRIGSGWMIP